MSQLRQSILRDEERVAAKSRFGLFSQPPPIAVGDDAGYSKIVHKKGQDGKPVTQPPQISSGVCKSGQGKSGYFSVPDSIYINDKFQETHKLQNEYQKKMHTKAGFHENEFKPASGSKTIMKSSYEHVDEKSDNKPLKRDQNGRVKTQPPNITSNQMQKVERQFMKFPKHMPDQYNRQKQLEKQYKEKQKRKMLNVDTIFKSASHGNRTFSKHSQTYGEDAKTKSFIKSKQRVKTMTSSIQHDNPFKPAIGHGDPIGKYPPFIDAQLNKNMTEKQKSLMKKGENKDNWKFNNFGRSRPTPSIGLNMKNLHLSKYRK